MTPRFLCSMLVLMAASLTITAQTAAGLERVTLHYFSHQERRPDASRASINFENGKRGVLAGDLPADFDLTYGGMMIEKDGEVFADWLRVADSGSMIVNLGKKKWEEVKETPPFPKPKKQRAPLPLTNRPIVIDASAGSKDFSPYRQAVEVKPGHMFLMRIVRGRKVIYTMFRVESLVSRDHCVLSWKHVRPPNVDDLEK